MKRKKTIVIVAHDIGPNGGMEKHLTEMIIRMKHEMNVVVVGTSLTLPDEVREGIRFVRVPVIRRPVPVKMIMFAILASIYLMFIKRDILHTTGAIVWNRADLSTVHFCHTAYHRGSAGRITENRSVLKRMNSKVAAMIAILMERIVYRPSRTSMMVTVSERVRRECLAHFPYTESGIVVVPNGVDLQTFHPLSPEEKRSTRRHLGLREDGRYISFIGGDWSRKGLDHVIGAFNIAAAQHKDLHLLVVGKGDPDSYKKKIKDHLLDRVHFSGKQPNPETWFGASDLFIFPSDYEAFSLVLLEAAASGLVILTTEIGGAEDLIVNGDNGYFVNRDSIHIAQKLEEILADWDEKRACGARARETVVNYSWDHTYERFRAIYGGFLNRTSKPVVKRNIREHAR